MNIYKMDLFKGFLFPAISFFLLLPFHVMPAQYTNLSFEEISIEDGLSQSIVNCIIQDNVGYLWFATEDGLNKYDGYHFTIFRYDPGDDNSLSYNEIRSIYQDTSGNFWIGCFYGGLNKYDPKEKKFTHYLHSEDNPSSLSHNNVEAITEDEEGNLWFGTDFGLNRYDRKTDNFYVYLNDPENPNSLSHNTVNDLFIDLDGSLWVATDKGLNQYNAIHDQFTIYQHDSFSHIGLSNNVITSICQDNNGIYWIGTENGLNRFNRDKNEFIAYYHQSTDPHSLSHNMINTIYRDSKGYIWVGTEGGGINIFDPPKNHSRKINFINYQNDPLDATSLSKNEVRCIYEDRSGIIWLGTYGGGSNKVQKRTKQFSIYRAVPNNPNSLPSEIVWSFYEDPSGILWIGTHGGGLTRLDRKNNQYTHLQHNPNDPNSLSNNIVRIIYPDPSDPNCLWIGTHGGGLCKFDIPTKTFICFLHDPNDPASISHNELRSIYKDRSGTLWIGTNGGGLNQMISQDNLTLFKHYRHDPNNNHSLSNDYVRVVYEAPEEAGKTLWIGTQGGGLEKFDRTTGKFLHYQHDPDNINSLSNNYVLSMYADSCGMFWIGTWGGGICKFDRKTESFKNYTMRDGLPQNEIYGFLQAEDGDLWISTNNGLSKFNPRTEHFKNYNIQDGLQSNEFNGGAFYKSDDNEMFFGGIHGFNAFFPENIKDNIHVPPIVLTSMLKFNREFPLSKPLTDLKEITLSYKDYIFSFEFAALDFTSPMKNKYAYKMAGLDEVWVQTDASKRFATYTTLAPGKYIFKVKGSNNDGVWNEKGTSINIVITPPFWKTWWFILIIACALAMMILLLYKRRLHNIKMKIELQAAHDAQMSIMPQSDPKLEGFDIASTCLPANEVGGDFFDYLWRDEKHTELVIAIGDVSGKAMTAAMTAVMASGIVNAKVYKNRSMQEIMTKTNVPVYHKTEKKVFITLCLALLNSTKKELCFSNAGLMEPLLISNGSINYLKSLGPRYPLGVAQDTVYKEKKVALKSGDVLILLTDGILEAQNRSKKIYGEKNLLQLLNRIDTTEHSARIIAEQIIKDVEKFTGKAAQHDDITMVVVKIK
ncbi:SpoIIE family protein phosphatase [candidate division KSB1 bacterium]|nr:SpoIIE family protein phosphatase [candidate division KSB1 bacterium]